MSPVTVLFFARYHNCPANIDRKTVVRKSDGQSFPIDLVAMDVYDLTHINIDSFEDNGSISFPTYKEKFKANGLTYPTGTYAIIVTHSRNDGSGVDFGGYPEVRIIPITVDLLKSVIDAHKSLPFLCGNVPGHSSPVSLPQPIPTASPSLSGQTFGPRFNPPSSPSPSSSSSSASPPSSSSTSSTTVKV